MDGAAERPVVGLVGAFDTGDLGEVALRRVMEAELARRRPDVDLVALAPFGSERPVPGDEGRPAHPLPVAAGRDAIRDALGIDALIVTGDVLVSEDRWAAAYQVAPETIAERGVGDLMLLGTRDGLPAADLVVWFATGAPGDATVDLRGLRGSNVWVRDPATQAKLGGTAVQSGDPLLLAASCFEPETLHRRADLLRTCGVLPAGRRLVVEVSAAIGAADVRGSLAEALGGVLRADPQLSAIVLSLDPTGPETPLRVDGLLAERVHHPPAWVGLDDIAAALSGSAAVIATTPAGAHLAAALGVPVAALETGSAGRFDPSIALLTSDFPARFEALLARGQAPAIGGALKTLDGAFSELAERLPRTPGPSSPRATQDPVESALAILQQRLVDERSALQAELSRLEAELEHLRASPEHRIARPIREGYQRWQRRRT